MKTPQQKKRILSLLQRLKKRRVEVLAGQLNKSQSEFDTLSHTITDSQKRLAHEMALIPESIGEHPTLDAYRLREADLQERSYHSQEKLRVTIDKTRHEVTQVYHEEKGLGRVIKQFELLIDQEVDQRDQRETERHTNHAHSKKKCT